MHQDDLCCCFFSPRDLFTNYVYRYKEGSWNFIFTESVLSKIISLDDKEAKGSKKCKRNVWTTPSARKVKQVGRVPQNQQHRKVYRAPNFHWKQSNLITRKHSWLSEKFFLHIFFFSTVFYPLINKTENPFSLQDDERNDKTDKK